MTASQTYSFTDVQASISGPGGSFSLGSGVGNAEEGITIDMIEDKNTMTIGADGSGMHSLHASKAARATVRLLKTSPANAMLSALYSFQQQSSALWGQNLITLGDIARGDQITLRDVAFARQAPVTYAKDGGVVEWMFDAIARDDLIGSGSPQLGAITLGVAVPGLGGAGITIPLPR
jgi:structural protein KPP10_ORF10